jgi:hypothetical protein
VDQIEGAQHGNAAMARPTNKLEYGEPVDVSDDSLAIDQE